MHYELSLEQADGLFQLETTRDYNGDGTDLYGQANTRFADSTTPNSKWWDGTASNLDVFQIGAPGATIVFRTRLMEDGGAQTIGGMSAPAFSIPDNNGTGVTDKIAIAQDGLITSARVTLDITHTYVGDLRVTLLTPWGDAIRLHDRTGSSTDNIQRTYDDAMLPALATLRGRSTKGDWRLQVQDLAAADLGRLNRWALEFAISAAPSQVVLEETPGTPIPDNTPTGITRSLSTNTAGNVGSVEVQVDINHTWIGDLRVSLRSPAGSEVVLHDQTGGSADNLAQIYTTATTPGLAVFTGKPMSGQWQLNVSDRAAQDVGKLNKWRLVINPA
jgi:subtilisin-like proprotein convertase family protein